MQGHVSTTRCNDTAQAALPSSRSWLQGHGSPSQCLVAGEVTCSRTSEIPPRPHQTLIYSFTLPTPAVEREICPHGQSAPERLILQVPADWAAQITPSVRGPGAAAPAVQGLKHESSLGREGTLGMSPCSAFRALRDVASSELGSPTDPHGPALALD